MADLPSPAYRCDQCDHEWQGDQDGRCPRCGVGIDVGNLVTAASAEPTTEQVTNALQRVTDAEALAAARGMSFVTVERRDLHLVLRFLATLARRHAAELAALASAAARR